MKNVSGRKDHKVRNLLRLALLLVVSLSLIACGQAVGVEGFNSGEGGTNTLMLSWMAPSTNEDGSPLQDLAGYKLYYGTKPGQYTKAVNIGGYTTAEIEGFGNGTYYLAVTAYDIYGNESNYSNEIYHTF